MRSPGNHNGNFVLLLMTNDIVVFVEPGRYIEVYKTRLSEIRIATNNFDVDRPRAFIGGGFGRPGPYDRFGGGMGRFGAATAGRRMRGM